MSVRINNPNEYHVAIYHRRSRAESDYDYADVIHTLTNRAKTQKERVGDTDLFVDKAERLCDQTNLKSLIRIKDKYHVILVYSPLTLANCSWTELVEIINNLDHDKGMVVFYTYTDLNLSVLIDMFQDWDKAKITERQRLVALNHSLYGRPPKTVDIEEAIKMRESGLTYKEISERMDLSLSFVYKHIAKTSSFKPYMKKRTRQRLEEKGLL